MKERYKLPVAVFVALIKGDSIFLMRRSATGWQDGTYDLISGHKEEGESLAATAAREAREEAGITIDANDLEFIHLIHTMDGNEEYFYVAFKASAWRGEPSLCEPEKCDEVGWFSLSSLPDNIAPSAKLILAGLADHQYYLEEDLS